MLITFRKLFELSVFISILVIIDLLTQKKELLDLGVFEITIYEVCLKQMKFYCFIILDILLLLFCVTIT